MNSVFVQCLGYLADTGTAKGLGVFAVALGYGSLYNHANPANLRYSADLDGEALRFVAARAIRSGEELTINYNDAGGDVVSSDDNWFRCNRVEYIGPPDEP